jgi:hypothetical protein
MFCHLTDPILWLVCIAQTHGLGRRMFRVTLPQRGKLHEAHHSFPVCAQTQQGQVLRFDLSDMLCDRDFYDQRRGTHPGRE